MRGRGFLSFSVRLLLKSLRPIWFKSQVSSAASRVYQDDQDAPSDVKCEAELVAFGRRWSPGRSWCGILRPNALAWDLWHCMLQLEDSKARLEKREAQGSQGNFEFWLSLEVARLLQDM